MPNQSRVGGSIFRLFPLPLQPLPASSMVPQSRREQLRHRSRCRLITMLNLVLGSLNSLALHASSHVSAPLFSLSSSLSPFGSFTFANSLFPSSSSRDRVIRFIFTRVRAFDADVRRRGSGPSGSVAGLCDSLFNALFTLFSSYSPSSLVSNPSFVLSSLVPSPFTLPPSSSFSFFTEQLPLSTSFHLDYLRESSLRDRAVPIIASRIALPSELNPVPILDALPPPLADLYSGPSPRLLLDQPRPVNRTPRVFGSHSEYLKLVRRLWRIGMITFTITPKVINGVFAVPKDEQEDRFIIDAVFANAHMVEPQKSHLPDPSHLSKLVLQQPGPLYVVKSDLSNFYHHLALPEWLQPYFCLVGLPLSDLGLPGSGLIYPMLVTTPMGWSHSVLLAQEAHQHTLYSSGTLLREHNLLNSGLQIGSQPLHGIYIDDFFGLCLDPEALNNTLDAVIAAYQRRGFIVKFSKVVRATADGVKVLGIHIDGRSCTVSIDATTRVELLQSILGLLSRRVVTGLELSSIVGKLTWCMLVNRPALQCLHRVYRFMEARRDQPSHLWPSVVRELLIACGLLPLLSATLTAPFCHRLIATDASEFGGAVVSRKLQPSEDPFQTAQMITPPSSSLSWSTIIQHRWRRPEHINSLEMRAILLALVWLTTLSVFGHRILLFTDSMVNLGVLLKGRTSAPTLRSVHSSLAALCLAAGLSIIPTHVPSELNPADGPSRFRSVALPPLLNPPDPEPPPSTASASTNSIHHDVSQQQ